MNSAATTLAEQDSSLLLELAERPAWIGVHELTEFVFCPRAGVLCHRASDGDTGQELDCLPRLDYLPDFDTIEIHGTLAGIGQQMESFLVGSIIGGFCLLLVGVFVNWVPAAGIAIAYAIPLRWFIEKYRICCLLEDHLKEARRQTADEPPLPLTERVSVNWWSLLKAGMTPVAYEEAHRDLRLCLAGSPWRVLQRGSLRIPVFRKRSGPPELRLQHFIRMEAYCHLVEECEMAEVPYAIVLFGDGYDGIAIPNRPNGERPFLDALVQARQALTDFETQFRPPSRPDSISACRNCHWGFPRRCRADDESAEVGNTDATFPTQGRDGVLYHSPCGDLFRWVPPTERAQQLGLSDGGA